MTSDPTKRFSATLAATSFVLVVELAGRDRLDTPLRVALLLFVCCIPILTVSALTNLFDTNLEPVVAKTWSHLAVLALALVYPCSILVSLAGIVCFLWHCGPRYAVAFALSSLVSLGILALTLHRGPNSQCDTPKGK